MARVWTVRVAGFCAILALTEPSWAQGFKPDPVDEAAAKREGKVTWYTSTPVAAGQYIANEFEKRTGIKVEMLRTGGQGVIRRFLQEADGGRISADMITMSDMSAANAMTKRGLFVPFKPEGFDKVIDSAKEANGNYIAQRLSFVGMVARTDKVADADMPKQWSDLTAPRYKGKLVMADPSFTAIQLMVVGTLSRKLGWQFYEGLRKNDTLIVQGHEQVYDMLKRGERVIAAESADPRVYTNGKPPANMRTIFSPDGTIVVPSPSAVVKGSPHPNAAKLFAQFNMTVEVQSKLSEDGRPSARTDVPPPEGMPRLNQIKVQPIDYDYIEANTRQLKAKFAEIFQ
jgi:iron(III) transport system substrate-binding protein